MGLGNQPDSSIVGSQASYSPTDLSKRTDRTSYSIPDDGRPITIPTTRRRKKDVDGTSNLSHGTNTSLLIEYFESGKHNSNGSSRRPSVRVKVTPSAAKRHNIKPSADGVQISEVGSKSSNRQGRKPSHTHRISLSPNVATEDRMILGEAPPSGRPRSHSGGHSTLSSCTSADDSNMGHHYPLSVTVIREANSPSSLRSSRDMDGMDVSYGSRRSARRNRADLRTDQLFEKEAIKMTKGRSRSVSRESNAALDDGLKASKLSRRRSRSLSRERVSMSQKEKDAIQQGVMEGFERLRLPKTTKPRSRSTSGSNGDGLKTPRQRSRSRSREEDEDAMAAEKRRARKASYNRDPKSGSNLTNNPAVLEAIEDAIKRLILPQLNELKTNQNLSRLEQSLNSPPPPGVDRSNSKRMGKSLSMPDVGKPMVVLSPDIDQGHGQGVVIVGGAADHIQEVSPLKIRREKVKVNDSGLADTVSGKSDSSFIRAPGLGPNHFSISSETEGEGVSLVGAVPPGQHLEMPDAPDRVDSPGTYAETRASILTAQSGLPPYPATARESGMPSSGTTPPPAPRSEFPELSELDLNLNVPSKLGKSRVSSVASLHSAGNDGHSTVSRTGPGVPSIVSFAPIGDLDAEDAVSGVSSRSGHSNAAPTTIQPGASEISIRSMSSTQSTKLARRRRKGKAKEDEISEINEGEQSLSEDGNGSPQKSNAADWYFANMREKAQERALLDPTLRSETIEARHVQTHTENAFEATHLEKLAAGQQVFALGANPSMRSTPVAANSAVASVLSPSNVDGLSNLSVNEPPQLGASTLPNAANGSLPDITNIAEEDEEINTNPSIIQGPIGHQPDDWKFDPPAQAANDLHLNGDRGMDPGENAGGIPPLDPGADRLSQTPQLKDEGYISAANPGMMSPGSISPSRGMQDPTMGMGGIDDLMSDGDFTPYQRGHVRMSSGNSHGMPSPLYDSATGRGIDRIQSKDIVALMDHLTVRDAQRNARDTEILVTLVRSAAEMRNSFEDMKKALELQQRQIVSEVEQNTERSVQKVIQGPRPLPPSAPRAPRYTKADEDAEDDGPAKRRSVFKRALKGLSGRSSNDLQRIEEMFMTLLTEVEALRGGQEFYQQSLMQNQSLGNVENHLKNITDASGTQNTNSIAGNSGYYSGVPSSQPSNSRIYQDDPLRQSTRISPIAEHSAPSNQSRSMPPDSSHETKPPPAAFGSDNTPTKSEKRTNRESGSSIFPKISRWSETTASSGMRGILGRKKRPEDGSDASQSQQDFWEAEAKANRQAEQFPEGNPYAEPLRTERAPSPLLPPSSRDADSPLQESNRISLDIHQPQPRPLAYHQAQALQLSAEGMPPQSADFNQSTSSLGNFPPISLGGFQNGKLMSPLAQNAYAQYQAQQNAALNPPVPSKTKDDGTYEPVSPARSEKSKKHRKDREDGDKPKKHKKERTEEEKQRRRERKERKERERAMEGGSISKKSRDVLSVEDSAPAFSGRTPSTASRLNGPRPLSSQSNKENTRRHRHHGSHATNDTFGNGPEYDNIGTLR